MKNSVGKGKAISSTFRNFIKYFSEECQIVSEEHYSECLSYLKPLVKSPEMEFRRLMRFIRQISNKKLSLSYCKKMTVFCYWTRINIFFYSTIAITKL